MMKMKLSTLAVLASLVIPALPATAMEKAEVEEIVHQYLVAHPEILIEMSTALRAKQAVAQEQNDEALIKQYAKELIHNPADPVGGNPDGRLTIVEFFDYNCGYCKRADPVLKKLLADNKDIRFVYKEFPILTETSNISAKAALAIHRLAPEKYEAFHSELMKRGSPLKQESEIADVITKLGLDWAKISEAMKDPGIDEQLQANRKLAEVMSLTGTPAFIIGNKVLRGAPRTVEDLTALVKEAKPL